jgi:prolipoprotein diacylglyceryltransferase
MITFLPIDGIYTFLGIKIPTWGTFLIFAIITFVFYFAMNIQRYNLSKKHCISILIHFSFWGYIGIHLYHYIITSFKSGTSFITSTGNDSAGLVLGLTAILIYLRVNKESFFKYFDALIMPLLTLQVIIRTGCMLVADELGKKAFLPWSIYYAGAWRHPIGLYYVLTGILILIMMYYLQKSGMKEGSYFLSGAMIYCFTRFLVDFYRSYPPHIYLSLSVHQVFFGISFIVLLVFLVWRNYVPKEKK